MRGGYWRGGEAKLANIIAQYASHFDVYRQPRLNSPGKYFAFFGSPFRFARYSRLCVMTITVTLLYDTVVSNFNSINKYKGNSK